jgi:hypothetical protein
VVTLTDAGAAFDVGMIGARIKIEDSTTADNDGTFVITHVPSATTVKYTNEDGVTEAFSGTWTILDEPQVEADRDFT